MCCGIGGGIGLLYLGQCRPWTEDYSITVTAT